MPTALTNYQRALVLTETVATAGIFPSQSGGGDGMTLGMFHTYAFNFGLAGAPIANGQILNIASNTALFSLLGTNYGGNGQTTFALPNLAGRTAVSDGQGPGLNNIAIGQQAGSAAAVLAVSQMPASHGGASAPVDEDQPELGVRYLIRTTGIFPTQGGSGSSLDLIGSVVKFAGNFTPSGYAACNGQLLSIAENDVLFAIIGTTYGGDGATTFALPDLRGRTIVGAGNGLTIGEVLGQGPVTVSQANLPVEMGGAGAPIQNVDPSLVLNYAIALTGIFPSVNGGADGFDPMIGEIIAFAGNFAPSGYALCQGQLLAISQNQALFSLLGTTYGGNGATTFALPDLRGRTALGSGGGFNAGDAVGSDTITLTLDNIPDLNFSGTGADESLYGGNGADTINGLGGSDILTGNGGNDLLDGGAANDTLRGGAGADTLRGGAGADALAGGADNDIADYSTSGSGVTVNLQTGAASGGAAAGDTFVSIEGITGSAFNDVLTGRDLVFDALNGGDGNDTLSGGIGSDSMSGGAGVDTLDYSLSPNAVDIRLFSGAASGGAANGDFFSGIENIVGSSRTDTLVGDDGVNFIWGGAGAETITGRDGADHLFGEAGNDVLLGGSGDDVLIGGAGADSLGGGVGADTADYSASAAAVNVNLQTGAGVGGDAQGDVYFSVDNVIGTSAADMIVGRNGWDNVLDGGASADAMSGGTGNDAFVFRAGQANGDAIFDFSSAAAGNNDSLLFVGYGTAAAGATFVQLDATHWQINSANGLIHDTITIANGASITASDWGFG